MHQAINLTQNNPNTSNQLPGYNLYTAQRHITKNRAEITPINT